MKVLLIEPPIMDYIAGKLQPIAQDKGRESPPYGIYLLSEILKQHGYEAVLADLIASGSNNITPYKEAIETFDLIGIGATSLSWPTAVDVIRQIRGINKEVPIVLGGIHPTMFDYYILKSFPVQFIVRGEGEIALPRLCAALEKNLTLAEVPNLSWWKANNTVVRNPAGDKIRGEALCSFPLPDYSRLPPGIYKGLSIESSRGCAFDCSFCSTSYRLTWRAMPAERFVDRLEAIMPYLDRTKYGVISIVDDEFSTNPRRAMEIAKCLGKRGLLPRLLYDSRANDLLYDGFVDSMSAFTYQFLVGAECGYDEGLKLIGKGTTCENLEKAAGILYERGMSEVADFSFILGLPWESRAEVEKTVAFAAHLHASYGVRILLQWFCQIPGSRLWDEQRRNGQVLESLYDEYGFFRNLYLFRSGVRIQPNDIWEIGNTISQLQWLSNLYYPDRKMIQGAFPPPIARYFPQEFLSSLNNKAGVPSLREVARPQPGGGAPQ